MSLSPRLITTEYYSAQQTKDHQETIAGLKKTYDMLEQDDAFYLEPSFLNSLRIKCEPLDFNDDGSYAVPLQPCFFQPLPLHDLLAHPINSQSANIQRDLTAEERLIEPEDDDRHLDRVNFMCRFMERQFRGYPRKGTSNDGLGLMYLTKWRSA
ncbi:hypothetical protein VTN77DRAFT_7878 [Rasamsonia byssochlamydoides]|uniref:uncharacterized protein n=1 Tax=Rasamsonia byssochlamydoides TaxID=89139 RepID=UPI003742A800